MTAATLFVLGFLVATAGLVVFTALALRDVPAPPTPAPSKARQARLVCPETGNLKRVWLDTAADGTPTIIRCDRFGHREITCNRACLLPAGVV